MDKRNIDVREIMRQLENILSASVFAEAGEFEVAQQIMKPDERVLLVMIGNPSDAKSLKYAENFCERMKARLEVLCPTSGKESLEASLQSIREKGIEYSVIETDGCLKQAMVDITTGNPDIRYVVVNSQSELAMGCRKEMNDKTDVSDLVGCSLVVVGA